MSFRPVPNLSHIQKIEEVISILTILRYLQKKNRARKDEGEKDTSELSHMINAQLLKEIRCDAQFHHYVRFVNL